MVCFLANAGSLYDECKSALKSADVRLHVNIPFYTSFSTVARARGTIDGQDFPESSDKYSGKLYEDHARIDLRVDRTRELPVENAVFNEQKAHFFWDGTSYAGWNTIVNGGSLAALGTKAADPKEFETVKNDLRYGPFLSGRIRVNGRSVEAWSDLFAAPESQWKVGEIDDNGTTSTQVVVPIGDTGKTVAAIFRRGLNGKLELAEISWSETSSENPHTHEIRKTIRIDEISSIDGVEMVTKGTLREVTRSGVAEEYVYEQTTERFDIALNPDEKALGLFAFDPPENTQVTDKSFPGIPFMVRNGVSSPYSNPGQIADIESIVHDLSGINEAGQTKLTDQPPRPTPPSKTDQEQAGHPLSNFPVGLLYMIAVGGLMLSILALWNSRRSHRT